MKIYTLWQAGDRDDDFPWLLDAVDEHTIDSVGVPSEYLKKSTGKDTRELILEIPAEAVRSLFKVPRVKATIQGPTPEAALSTLPPSTLPPRDTP